MLLKKSKSKLLESIHHDDVTFLTIEECAAYLRVHYVTFAKWIANGKGPPTKRFSHQCIRIPKKSFFEWAENRSK
jgi:excisionase family DNA binding protein